MKLTNSQIKKTEVLDYGNDSRSLYMDGKVQE